MPEMPTDEYIEQRLKMSLGEREEAKREYTNSVHLAVLAGWTNVRIARTVQLSEAAIRQLRKRHGF